MPLRLDASDAGFAAAFTALVDARRESDADVSRDVSAILARVRAEGDAALHALTQQFDRHDLDITGWEVSRAEGRAALDGLEREPPVAIEPEAMRVGDAHANHRPLDSETVNDAGVRLGSRWRAADAAGLYAPGGRAAYP